MKTLQWNWSVDIEVHLICWSWVLGQRTKGGCQEHMQSWGFRYPGNNLFDVSHAIVTFRTSRTKYLTCLGLGQQHEINGISQPSFSNYPVVENAQEHNFHHCSQPPDVRRMTEHGNWVNSRFWAFRAYPINEFHSLCLCLFHVRDASKYFISSSSKISKALLQDCCMWACCLTAFAFRHTCIISPASCTQS